MVSVSFGFSSMLGIIHVLGALAYIAISIAQIARIRSTRNDELPLYIFQLIFAPSILVLSGLILLFQGWRLDPLMQFQQLLLSGLIGYLTLLNLKRSV